MSSAIHTAPSIGSAQIYLAIDIGDARLGPVGTYILVLSLCVALISVFNLWRIGQREDRGARFEDLLGAALHPSRSGQPGRRRWQHRFRTVVATALTFGREKPVKSLAVLDTAGITRPRHLVNLIASRVCVGGGFVVFSWLALKYFQFAIGGAALQLGVLSGAIIFAWRFPQIILSHMGRHRRRGLERGMPDALDLLVICTEAGLSLNQAIEQVSRDLRSSNRVVAQEFAATAAEMRVLADRGQALENLAYRTGLGSLRSIIATLNQSAKFGTPLATSLRVLATEMRTERLARIEERAARLPVLLSIPLMAFILPSLMIIICTPLVLHIIDMMGSMLAKRP